MSSSAGPPPRAGESSGVPAVGPGPVPAGGARVAPPPAPPGPGWLDPVESAVSAEVEAQGRRGDGLDTKAGLVLGFAGVLVGLTVGRPTGAWRDAGLALASLSALLGVAAVVPRPYPTLDLRYLRTHYAGADPARIRLRITDTRIAMYERTQLLLRVKSRLVTCSAVALAVAVVAIAVSVTVAP